MPTHQGTCAAVVTLYFSDLHVVQNILRWLGQVDRIYAVDNSDQPDIDVVHALQSVKNLVYLPQYKNVGVATALNLGAHQAICDGYTWLLTMDQDSIVAEGHVTSLFKALSAKGGADGDVAVIAPFHQLVSNASERRTGVFEVETVMTSGCLMNLAIYKIIGPFLDDLFIDGVDDEFCLRARSRGYRILQCHDVSMQHALGDITEHSYRGRTMYVSNHSRLRRYYITRNRLYLTRLYQGRFPTLFSSMITTLRGDVKGIVLFEKDKLGKLFMMFKGWCDFRRGRMGKLDV